ncbi:MAG: FxLYD domain-containing protein [Thermoanaerobaculia bacterium]
MRSNSSLLLAAALLVTAAPLHADWLVTVDGDEIQTEGAWKVDGPRVVFTLPGGSLAALPAAEIDLAASEARTHPAPPAEEAPAAEAAPAAKAASRWVITDNDVARAYPAAVAPEGGAADEEAAPATPSIQGLTVASWEEVDPDDVESGLALRGTVRNASGNYATSVRVRTMLYDADGHLLEMKTATPVESTLEPDASSEFRVDFPDVTSYSGVQFTVEARGIAASGAAAAGEDSGD